MLKESGYTSYVTFCFPHSPRDWSRALTAGHSDEAEEGAAGRQPQREDRPETRPHGAGGEEHPAGGFQP